MDVDEEEENLGLFLIRGQKLFEIAVGLGGQEWDLGLIFSELGLLSLGWVWVERLSAVRGEFRGLSLLE